MIKRVLDGIRKVTAKGIVAVLGRMGYRLARHQFHQEQDIDLRMLLTERIQRRKATLSVVQIGANDGLTNDPIHHLVVASGWKLLAVEPLTPAFGRLQATYAGCDNVTTVQCAVALEDGEATMYALRGCEGQHEWDDHLASFSLDVLKKHWRRVPNLEERIQEHQVPALSFKSLLSKYQVEAVDFLQIDTEGFDFEILRMALDEGLRPAVVAFEWEHLTQQAMWETRCRLIEAGYRWLVVKGDVVAAHSSLFEEVV